jgi:Domain of unknown function (DUF5666)
MNDYDPASPQESDSDHPLSSATSASSPEASTSATMAEKPRRARVGRLFPNRRSRWITAAALMAAVIGLSAYGASKATATSPSAPAAGSGSAGGFGSGGGGSNARSGPAAGGASGTVTSVSSSSFTLTTSAGQLVTVDETSSTTYQDGTGSTSAGPTTTGETVVVLGTTSETTITATQVIVQPTSVGSAASSAAGVIPFQRGAATTSKQVGQIPASYSQGSGTIVSRTTANKATEAALAAYPGGVVDRVVQLSNGEFEVHYIGVNWPHHIFVDQDFKVVGAN